MNKKEQKIIDLAMKGGNDSTLILFDDIQALEEKLDKHIEYMDKEMEGLDTKLDSAVKEVKEEVKDSIPNLDKVLESVRGKDSKPEEVAPLIKEEVAQNLKADPEFQELTKGEKGDDYILTEKDKKEIAESIEVPIVEKVIEKTEVIREQPIEIVKEVALNETPEQNRDKLETLKDGEKLSIQAIQDLAKILEELRKVEKVKGGGGFSKIHMDRHFVDDETPTGAINSTNVTFTISKAPNPVNSLKIYVGGIRLRVTEDYTFSGRTITFITAPLTNSIILCDFRY